MGFAICSSAGAPLGGVQRAGCALRDPLDEGVAGADRVMARYELPDASVLDGQAALVVGMLYRHRCVRRRSGCGAVSPPLASCRARPIDQRLVVDGGLAAASESEIRFAQRPSRRVDGEQRGGARELR